MGNVRYIFLNHEVEKGFFPVIFTQKIIFKLLISFYQKKINYLGLLPCFESRSCSVETVRQAGYDVTQLFAATFISSANKHIMLIINVQLYSC